MIELRRILRGAIVGVLPGFLVGWAAFVASSAYSRSIITPGRILLSVLAGATAAAGSSAVLFLLRHRLRSNAGVDGRRAFVVGLGTVGIFITIRPFLPHIGTVGEVALVGITGAALSLAMFFPWLRSRSSEPEKTLDVSEPASLSAPAMNSDIIRPQAGVESNVFREGDPSIARGAADPSARV
jgi:hypothetical protein